MVSNVMHPNGQENNKWAHENQCQQPGRVRTLHGQGNDCVGCALGIATAPGSDVTCCSIENPSITRFFLVAYLE
jgi:hypothetical protein